MGYVAETENIFYMHKKAFSSSSSSPPGDVPGEVDGVDALEDDVVGLHGVGAGEGRGARQQLEHEDAERPVVGADVVALVQDDLRSHVLWRPAEGPRLAPHLELLGEAEVDELDVPGSTRKNYLAPHKANIVRFFPL